MILHKYLIASCYRYAFDLCHIFIWSELVLNSSNNTISIKRKLKKNNRRNKNLSTQNDNENDDETTVIPPPQRKIKGRGNRKIHTNEGYSLPHTIYTSYNFYLIQFIPHTIYTSYNLYVIQFVIKKLFTNFFKKFC